MENFSDQKVFVRPWGLHVINKEGFLLKSQNLKTRLNFIANKCLESKKKRILVEAQTTVLLATPEEFAVGLDEIRKMKSAEYKIAVVAPKIIDSGKTKIIEKISQEYRLNLKYFYDKNIALKWLTSDVENLIETL